MLSVHRILTLIVLVMLSLVGCGTAQRAEPHHVSQAPSSGSAEVQSGVETVAPTVDCPDAKHVTDLAAGGAVACAAVDGRVSCWGYIASFIDGAETGGQKLRPPTWIDAPPDIVRVATNGEQIYGVDDRGDAYRLRRGSSRRLEREKIAQGVRDIIVGAPDGMYDTLCFHRVNGTFHCYRRASLRKPLGKPDWVFNDVLELKIGLKHICVRMSNYVACQPIFSEPPLRLEGAGTGLFVDYGSVCLLNSTGQPVCSGVQEEHVLASFGATSPREGLTASYDARWGHCLAGHDVSCWMGFGWDTEIRITVPLADEVVMGKYFGCSRCGDEVACWGESAKIWLGSPSAMLGLVPVPELDGVTSLDGGYVDSGGEVVCAEHGKGALCWGSGFIGRKHFAKGQRPPKFRQHERKTLCTISEGDVTCGGTKILGGALQLVQVSAGFACARLSDDVVCWGKGKPTHHLKIPSPVDVAVNTVGDVCVVTAAGELWCQALGVHYSLLILDVFKRGKSKAEPVLGLTDVEQVTLHRGHGCVLHRGGSVSCFGDSMNNRLGEGGSFVTKPYPISFK